jgi:hypothetical protein
MEQTGTLISDYINFSDQQAGLTGAELIDKELTFCAAAAVSQLCDEQEWGANIDECLYQRDDFKFIRELDLVSSVYSAAPINQQAGINSTPPIIAWSGRLQTIFLGFSYSRDVTDPEFSLSVSTQAAEGVGSRFCQGLIDRSREFVPLVEWLMERYKVVVCGHSFG